MSFIGRRPWAFAAFYVVVSLLVEIVLIVGAGWKVPQDNARIAPILLTLPPLLVVGASGYRRPLRDFAATAALTALLTVAVTVVVNRLSGITTGLIEPIINRSAAGWLAAAIMNRVTARFDRNRRASSDAGFARRAEGFDRRGEPLEDDDGIA